MEQKLKVKEIIELEKELNAFLEEDFNHGKKYHIEIFLNSLKEFIEPAEKMRKNLIGKYGDGISISPVLPDGSANPNVQKFWEEYNAVLEEEVMVNCHCNEIDLDLLNTIKSDKRYKLIYIYIIKK